MEETVLSGSGLGTFALAHAWPLRKTRCLASCCTPEQQRQQSCACHGQGQKYGHLWIPQGHVCRQGFPLLWALQPGNYSINAPSLLIELVLTPWLNCWLRLGSTERAMQRSGAWVLQSHSGFRYGPRSQKETGLVKLFGIIAQPSW